MNVAS